DEEHGLDLLESRVDGALHVLGQGVERSLEAGQVGEDQLVVVAVRDTEDAPPRGLRLVRDDRDLAAAERVHERRLADVRATGDGDEAGLQLGRSHVCGSRSAAECVTSSPLELRNVISPIWNSYSHWRQPPHGDAVIPIAAMSPGLYPSLTALTSADFSAQTPSGYAAFSTLTPSKSFPSVVCTTAPTR